jgi:hypothetical protein
VGRNERKNRENIYEFWLLFLMDFKRFERILKFKSKFELLQK